MTGAFDIADTELLAQALRGEEEPFTLLYRRRQGGVFRFAFQMSGSVALAEDLTPQFRVYPMSSLHIAVTGEVGFGWRF